MRTLDGQDDGHGDISVAEIVHELRAYCDRSDEILGGRPWNLTLPDEVLKRLLGAIPDAAAAAAAAAAAPPSVMADRLLQIRDIARLTFIDDTQARREILHILGETMPQWRPPQH